MFIEAVTSVFARQLRYLRMVAKLTAQLGRNKLTHLKPNTGAKLATKPGHGAVHTPATATQHPRRKRSTAPPSVSHKQSVLNPQRLPQYEHTRIGLCAKVLASFERTQPVVTMSISDFRLAVERMFSGPEKLTPSVDDEAILNMLERAKFKHDMVADSKAIQERLEGKNLPPPASQASTSGVSTEHEIIRTQLESENEKREMLSRGLIERLKWLAQVKQVKKKLFALAQTARRGEQQREYTLATLAQVAVWARYERTWRDIQSGNVQGSISVDGLPHPSLNDSVTLADYEDFVLSPVRPGYERWFMRARLSKERALWDEANVLEKVVPLCDNSETAAGVLRGAKVLRTFLDVLVAKYYFSEGVCDNSTTCSS